MKKFILIIYMILVAYLSCHYYGNQEKTFFIIRALDIILDPLFFLSLRI